jgi:hypothetical protein
MAGSRTRATMDAGVARVEAAHLVFATCGFRHAVDSDVAVTVGSNALLCFWCGHADLAPQARLEPRIHVLRGLTAKSDRALVLATSAFRDVVELLVVVKVGLEYPPDRECREGPNRPCEPDAEICLI